MLIQEAVRRKKNAVDSANLFLFWLLLVICEIFPFQTLIRHALKQVLLQIISACSRLRLFCVKLLCLCFQKNIADLPRFCLFYIAYGFQLVALVLSAIADVPPDFKEVTKKVDTAFCVIKKIILCHINK